MELSQGKLVLNNWLILKLIGLSLDTVKEEHSSVKLMKLLHKKFKELKIKN
jgi:hypothetical protein